MENLNIILPKDLTQLHREGGEPLRKAYTEMRDVARKFSDETLDRYNSLDRGKTDRSVYESAFRRAIIFRTLLLYYDTVVDYFEEYEQMMKEIIAAENAATNPFNTPEP